MASNSPCPFLFMTRTILKQPTCFRSCRSRHASPLRKEQSRRTIKPVSSNDPHERPSFLKQKAQGVMARKAEATSKSMMTPAERAAFDDIWRLFETPSAKFSGPSQPTNLTINDKDTDWQNLLQLLTPAPQPQQDVSPTELDEGIEDLLQQPDHSPSISAAQSSLIQSTAETVISDVATSLRQALGSTTKPIDQAIWAVCEQEVFPMIQLLIPQGPLPAESSLPESTSSPSSKNKSKSKTEQPPSSPASEAVEPVSITDPLLTHHPLIPPSVPLLPVLSLIYPTLILLTLRLLYVHCPSSPYTISLLPTIKSLGLNSYVLGTSTHFYNTLLRVRWEIYSDLNVMAELLAEMERNGVDFDPGTMKVLKEIRDERTRELNDDSTVLRGRGKIWWNRWEIRKRYALLEDWRMRVARQLEERGLGEVEREGAAGIRRSGRHAASETRDEGYSDYVVTL